MNQGKDIFISSAQKAVDHETHELHEKVLYRDECYAIQGAVFEVYREMGCGFLEPVYQECVEREFFRCGIPYVSQSELRLYYKGDILQQLYKPDIICYGKIIIELKAVKQIASEHRAQIFNYLKGSGLRLGLLVNFGHYPKVEIERVVL